MMKLQKFDVDVLILRRSLKKQSPNFDRTSSDHSGCCLDKVTTATERRMEGTNYLEGKEYLMTLELCFDWDEDIRVLLESLRPHPNLKELKVECYGGVSFPNWMIVDKIGLLSSLPNLVRIDMDSCKRCKHLPLFGQLPSLQFLTLWSMDSLEYIENSSSGSGNGGEESLSLSLPSSSLCSGGATARTRLEPTPTPTFFPSLKVLELYNLPNLKGWWRSEAAEDEAVTTSTTATLTDQQQHEQHHFLSLPYWLPSFPSLSKLTIQDCPNLASMPILQPDLEELHLRCVSKKLVQQQLMMTSSSTILTTTAATSSSSSSLSLLHLSKLKSLDLKHIEDLVTLPEWIGNVTSLERFYIEGCRKLTSLPEGMRGLVALRQLCITSCSNVLHHRCQKEIGEDRPKIAHIPYVHLTLYH